MSRITRKELETLVTILNSKLGLEKGDNRFIELEIQVVECTWYKLTSFEGSCDVSHNLKAKELEIFMRGMIQGIEFQKLVTGEL